MRLKFKLIISMSVLLNPACVSSPSESVKDASLPEVLTAGQTAQAVLPPVIVNYERRPSLQERLEYLNPPPSPKSPAPRASSNGLDKTEESPKTSADSVRTRLDPLLMLVKSERWNDVLAQSRERWTSCQRTRSTSEDCQVAGRTRAVALTRLGYISDAMSIFDSLTELEGSARNALLFAGLLADSGSPRLCAQLARTGLQWEPVDVRADLYATLSQCLRRDAQPDAARTVLNRALNEYPNRPPLLLESALLFLSAGNLTQGCDLLERLYLQEFNDIAVFYNWGQCVVKRRDPETAKIVLHRARRLWPSERLWILLAGEIAFLEGDRVKARRDGMDYLSGSEPGDMFKPQAERLIRYAQGD